MAICGPSLTAEALRQADRGQFRDRGAAIQIVRDKPRSVDRIELESRFGEFVARFESMTVDSVRVYVTGGPVVIPTSISSPDDENWVALAARAFPGARDFTAEEAEEFDVISRQQLKPLPPLKRHSGR